MKNRPWVWVWVTGGVGAVIAACSSGGNGAAPTTPPITPPTEAGVPADAADDASVPGADAFLQKLDTFEKGGTIPAANGAPAFVVVANADGTRTVTAANTNGTPRLTIQWKDDSAYTVKGDVDGNGVLDEQVTVTTTNGVTTALIEQDQNLGGKFNWRNTITRRASTRFQSSLHSVIEEISPFGTDFEVTASYNGTAYQFGKPTCVPEPLPGTTCASNKAPPMPKYCPPPEPPKDDIECGKPGGEACIRFAADNEAWLASELDLLPLFRNFFVIRKGPMACKDEQLKQLKTVLLKSGVDTNKVLPPLNTKRYGQIMIGLAHQPILYGCDLPATGEPKKRGIIAVTAGAWFDAEPNGDHTFDRAKVSAYDPSDFTLGDDYLEELLVHEWIHIGGDSHPHDPDGWEQRDWIYSCSRIIDGGRAFAQGHYLGTCCDASSARDFASCVSADKKADYGIQNIFKETPTSFIEVPDQGFKSFMNIAVPDECFDGNNGTHEQCGCSLHRIPSYCDQVTLTEQDALTHFDLTAGANSLSTYNCCERCSAAAPLTRMCGTHDPTSSTACVPGDPSPCASYLPAPGAQLAAGPTVPLRNPSAALLEGQATWPGGGANTKLNCPPVMGFLY